MEKVKDLNELVWAKKEGRPRRQFSRLNLQSMGQDDQGRYGDGWEIVDETEEPDEVKEAKKKATKSTTKPAAKTAKAKADSKKEEATVVPLNPDTPTDATKTDTDNGQDQFTAEENAERGTEGPDVSGSAAAPSGEGH